MNDKDKKCCEKCATWDTYSENTYCAESSCPCHTEKKEDCESRFDEKFEELYEPEMTEGDVIRAFSGVKPLADRVKSFISQEIETARKERDEGWRGRVKDILLSIECACDANDCDRCIALQDLLNKQ